MRSRCASAVAVVAVVLAGLAGCDTGFMVDTGWQNLDVNADQLGMKGGKLPNVSCTSDQMCGSGIPCGSSTFSCNFGCVDKQCQVAATYEHGTVVDLRQAIKNQTTATVLSHVSLNRVVFNTDVNTLSIDTPQFDLYLGGQNATKTTDKDVVRFATVPSIKAKTQPNNYVNVTDAGKAELEKRVYNYQNPFKLFGKVKLTFKGGQELPSGRLKLKIKAYFKIEPL